MEFFARTEKRMRANDVQKYVCIGNLPSLCGSISQVLEDQGDRGDIYCTWGEFRVHRELIRGGVRFTLPTCPNGVQWTIAVEDGAAAGNVCIHCSINRPSASPEFVESLERFVADWKDGLDGGNPRPEKPTPRDCDCMPWFG